jgi:hypothetical protein
VLCFVLAEYKVLFGSDAVYIFVPVSLVAWSMERACGRSLVGLTVLIPAGVMDVCLS